MRILSDLAVVLAIGACTGAPVETGGETGEPQLTLAPERPRVRQGMSQSDMWNQVVCSLENMTGLASGSHVD